MHPSSSLGDFVVMEANASIGCDAVVGSGAYIGEGTKVLERARIGPNATLAAGITIGANAEIRPGAVVMRSVPPTAIVEGNPANIVGYVDAATRPSRQAVVGDDIQASVQSTAVKGVTIHRFPLITDLRGSLTVGEFSKDLPFQPLRYFMVFDVPNREIRGEHAHRECQEFLTCIRGSCAIVADDGINRVEVTLDALNFGVYLPPMVWRVHYKYSHDAMVLVFASHHYDALDYVRNYSDFLALAALNRS